MENIQFDNFTIKIKDLIVEEENGKVVFYITDSEVKQDEFDAFLSFFKEHHRGGSYFKTTINGNDFYGRFGQLIYSKHSDFYNLRLIFVVAEVDQQEHTQTPFVLQGPDHKNVIEKVIVQETIIQRLLQTLKEKGILSEEQETSIVNVTNEDVWMKRAELYYKVENLDTYLEEKKDTLIYIREQDE